MGSTAPNVTAASAMAAGAVASAITAGAAAARAAAVRTIAHRTPARRRAPPARPAAGLVGIAHPHLARCAPFLRAPRIQPRAARVSPPWRRCQGAEGACRMIDPERLGDKPRGAPSALPPPAPLGQTAAPAGGEGSRQ
ncbi:MAG: hypothetical protein U1F67_15465 [Rubrivivax sp.]